jgi:dTDP-4-dehydrorhamnose reductase
VPGDIDATLTRLRKASAWQAERRYRNMKILIVGAGGRLGAALTREYRDKFDVAGLNHAQLDLANFDQTREKLRAANFDILINAAAFTNVDLCETQRDEAFRINAEAPRILAEICRDKDAKLIHFSTDYVFDGEKREPYTERDEANPISVYGESKLAGEKNVLAAQDRHLVVRVSWVFGPDRPSFIDGMIKRAQENEEIDAVADKISTPTYTHDIAGMLPQFFDCSVAGGTLHFANAGECSWREYAQWALDCCQEAGLPLKAKTVGVRKLTDMTNWIARRPVYSVLSSAKYTKLTGRRPRAWREAVADYIRRSYSKK